MGGSLDGREIALRLALTVLAGLVLGFNRGAHGKAAGLRTTLLVCAAASLAMLQASAIWSGSAASSVAAVRGDVLRLPLGILSGIGFIGGGAILRRGELVQGVTTAATLWFATVIGLCLGGGQFALGLPGLAIGFAVLTGLHWVEDRIPQYRTATLSLTTEAGAISEQELRSGLAAASLRIAAWTAEHSPVTGRQHWTCRLAARCHPTELRPPALVEELARRPGTLEVRWQA